MKLPPKSPDLEAAVNNLHRHYGVLEETVLMEVDQLAKTGFSDKRWCAIARTKFEEAFMALHRALRDYPGSDPNNYGKVPLDAPLPREFAPPTDMPDQYGRDRNVAPKGSAEIGKQISDQRKDAPHVEWGDYSPDGDLGPPGR